MDAADTTPLPKPFPWHPALAVECVAGPRDGEMVPTAALWIQLGAWPFDWDNGPPYVTYRLGHWKDGSLVYYYEREGPLR